MRLQRLEIAGFKSFSDRSELAFDQGVTAIVGPNGCGKSNVADAITWVLGEQSARSLRGDRMEDVIFSGSDARRPTGAAEVRLRLTDVLSASLAGTGPSSSHRAPAAVTHAGGNGHRQGNGRADGTGHSPRPHHELNELDGVGRAVEVTRRLYRSGESEYLIDGETCRLRDVHELLMDTGLGAKAYAIIEQGKIGMILSSRPADRRQLIEEAAGITKYKARRRAAELRLDAARQNLTRIDDIVFEVEKQRGTLQRQSAKARRYKRLRDELRRWEKVLFARRYRQLAEVIESTRAKLAAARAGESAASANIAAIEGRLAAARIRLAEAESAATAARETAHATELDINRREQQVAFDTQQIIALEARVGDLRTELEGLEARREPGRRVLAERREAAARAELDRDSAGALLAKAEASSLSAHQTIEGLEGDVEAARSEVFAAINAATALGHALEHAATAEERVSEQLSKLDVELSDLRSESETAAADRAASAHALHRAQEVIEITRLARAARETELACARLEHDSHARRVRAQERELAACGARLRSLEELDAERAGYADAARVVLAHANGNVGQMGSVADYLDTDRRYERAVEACLGDLLQHVVVPAHEHAVAGLQIIKEQDAGRCGFLVVADGADDGLRAQSGEEPPAGLVSLGAVVRIGGPHARLIEQTIGPAWIADTFEQGLAASRLTAAPIATLAGDVLRGQHLVYGGGKAESRGILATKREVRELRDRIAQERKTLDRMMDSTASLETTIARTTAAIEAFNAEQHHLEKSIVGFELRVVRATEDEARLKRKAGLLGAERRSAEEERGTLIARQVEARDSIARLDAEQREADERLARAQRRLFEAREGVEDLTRRAAEAKASHAALVERSMALVADVQRLEDGARDLDERVSESALELDQADQRARGLRQATIESKRLLDAGIGVLEQVRQDVRVAEQAVTALREDAERHEQAVREARRALETIRTAVGELDVARATAEGDLAHLASACVDAVQATLDEVRREIEELESSGALLVAVVSAEEMEDAAADEPSEGAGESRVTGSAGPGTPATMTAEDAIAGLRERIERLGPVNMMAIDQFDELEARHAFLTTQRKDLVDSIAATGEAITRIDETTNARFREAFAAVNTNFQETFSTLFGGGHAGLTLLDEDDVLDSGIEIIAQPPGKRLQSVQLLSGGEKALTAIALMFGIFRYKPSPFCLLDEIDAPLDDANIGRFIEMLRAMLAHTQFILITHNRKTMEIADRLYGVTMEEPGVSKLISVQLN